MTVEAFCSQPNRLEQCLACPIAEGDEASIAALNVLMRSVNPNHTKSRELKTWSDQISANYPGSDPKIVVQAALEHAAGNCTSDYQEI